MKLVFCVLPLSVVIWVDPTVVIPGCAEVDGAVELNPADLVVVDIVGVDVTPSPDSVDGWLKLLFGTTLVPVVVRKPNIVGIGLMVDAVLVVPLVDSDKIRMFKVVGLPTLEVVFVVKVVVVVAVVVVVVLFVMVVAAVMVMVIVVVLAVVAVNVAGVISAITVDTEVFGISLETVLLTVVVRKPNKVGLGLKMGDIVLVVLLVDSDEENV